MIMIIVIKYQFKNFLNKNNKLEKIEEFIIFTSKLKIQTQIITIMSQNINNELKKQDGVLDDLIKKNTDTLEISEKSHNLVFRVSERITTSICQRIILKLAILCITIFWVFYYVFIRS